MIVGQFCDTLPLLGHFQDNHHETNYAKLKIGILISQHLNHIRLTKLVDKTYFQMYALWDNKYDEKGQKFSINIKWLEI